MANNGLLIVFFVLLITINALSSVALWFNNRAPVYRYSMQYWLLSLVVFFLNGAGHESTKLFKTIAFDSGIISMIPFGGMFFSAIGLPAPRSYAKAMITIFGIAILVAVIQDRMGANLLTMSLIPMVIEMCGYSFLCAYALITIRKTGSTLSLTGRLLWLATASFGVYVITAPMTLGDSDLEAKSFMVVTAVTYAIAMFSFSSAIETLQKQAARQELDTMQSEKEIAEKLNESKSLFLANISHELRTPMHGILSFAQFGKTKSDSPKEKLVSYFNEIYDSGSRLMTLLNDLLDLSKLEAGKMEYSKNTASLADSAQVVAVEMRAFAAARKLLIHTLPVNDSTGYFDDNRIRQVIRNLVSNAIKFSNPDTVIEIETVSTPSSLFCRVRNQGTGVPKGELESIFDKFVQSSKTVNGSGGTGLGLSICKEIVQDHGGKIWAESTSSGQTTFTFEIERGESQKKVA